MTDYGHDVQFGVFLTPEAAQAREVLELAQLAELVGLDLVTFQDHPYQPRFLDTWTLISVIAANTSSIRVAPNVVNLPLRPPAMLARSVATLDLLSGGRVELGLGAGAFWDGVASLGGPRRTPGQSVDALAEAIEIIRAFWAPEGTRITFEGEHYAVKGARSGPRPVHDVELWLGAYKPRMLALTGAKADGWVPSDAYLDPSDLPEMNARIDDAATEAGRDPSEIRRLLNITGRYASGDSSLEGGPRDWAEQLAEMTLATGMATYIFAPSSADELRTFAAEVAPAVRELVAAHRSGAPEVAAVGSAFERSGAGDPVRAERAPLAAVPTPEPPRLTDEELWDGRARPTRADPDDGREFTAQEQAAGRHLIDVHDNLRAELDRLRDLVGQVARGSADPQAVRSFINRMTIRQNNWTLGVFCETYCRVVTTHHTLEDTSVFPHLRHSEPGLVGVLDRLGEEHEIIAEMLERVDRALVALVSPETGGIDRVQHTVDVLTDALLSHFSYEERELIEPLARLGFY